MEIWAYYLLGILVLLDFFVFFFLFRLNRRVERLSRGKKLASLEDIIFEQGETLLRLGKEHALHGEKITSLEKKLPNLIQHIAVKRFDALGDASGEQSFALALLDGEKNGVVISSLYTRNGVNVFAKEVKAGNSSRKLTAEEKSVIHQ